MAKAKKRLRPFFKYFGSKHRLAPHYPSPQHNRICELFAGSAQYALLHYHHDVFMCESSPDIAELWRWLIHEATPAYVRTLPVVLPQGTDIRSLDIPYGAQVLIRQWQRTGAPGCWTISKWNNSQPGFWSHACRNNVAEQLQYIRHWDVVKCDVMNDLDALKTTGEATWFIDPPYQTQAAVYGNPPLDYAKLADFCRTAPGQVIACEDKDADWLPFRLLRYNTAAITRAGSRKDAPSCSRRPEMVWFKD